MKFSAIASAVLLTTAAVAPGSAQTLQYTLTGNDSDGTVEYASFRLDAHPVVLSNNFSIGGGFRLKFVQGIFQYGSIIATLQDLQFFNGGVGGGFINLDPADKTGDSTFLDVSGPQLYSGPENTPTLLVGNYRIFDSLSGAPLSLNVAAITAVPEPATWAMMLIGMGVMGCAERRRQKVTARVSYAV